jgi:outer membrane protein OmpA-like peptidoglycan-associated protein
MDGNHDVSHSFTDLMTSLAVIFILLLVAALNQQFKGSKDDIEVVRKELNEILKNEKIEIQQDPNDPFTQVIKLDENNLKFAKDSSDLDVASVKPLRDLASKLAKVLCRVDLKTKIESIIFEGHTDNSGDHNLIGKLDNIELSQNRAYSVLSEALQAIDDSNEVVECLRNMASATGRGSSRPVGEDRSKQQQNRRVEIKIRVKPPEFIAKSLKEAAK